jgi:hypothetical protein
LEYPQKRFSVIKGPSEEILSTFNLRHETLQSMQRIMESGVNGSTLEPHHPAAVFAHDPEWRRKVRNQ